jgi:hypothetical protein
MQFRFPGRVELRYAYDLPHVGQVVASEGRSFRVAAVETDEEITVCTLERTEASDAGRVLPPGKVDE